ncbi:hypothetical protein [uncultured Arcanobacterium sp.]|uniref:hypothetical protein n=1 Tax=uncultured Arcanobacterium sp. TaxID=487520 RepID=UPI0026336EF6|nr:hypothetical protein [uncultured Arcanobacterium sp.]
MFTRHRASLPDFIYTAAAQPPLAASVLETAADTELWLAAWPQKLGIIGAEVCEFIEWADFLRGAWDSESRTLTLTFVNPKLEALIFQFPADYDETLILMIRERIDRSVVFQQFTELPSGGIARGQVRRNADESLFTQIIADATPAPEDQEVLWNLEADLRDAAGLSGVE